jgi:Ca2+-binding EF-hand superfamily protein
LSQPDISKCYNYFDEDQSGRISREEYAKILSLTDYELDLAVDRIRVKLLSASNVSKSQSTLTTPGNRFSGTNFFFLRFILEIVFIFVLAAVCKASVGVLGAGTVDNKDFKGIGLHRIRESVTLCCIFQTLNTKDDNILSLDEIMDLAAKVEIFLTEEESRKVLLMMDIDGDDRVEESDFISFMKKESTSVIKKAYRVRESAALLRRWLVRGTSEKSGSTTATGLIIDLFFIFLLILF